MKNPATVIDKDFCEWKADLRYVQWRSELLCHTIFFFFTRLRQVGSWLSYRHFLTGEQTCRVKGHHWAASHLSRPKLDASLPDKPIHWQHDHFTNKEKLIFGEDHLHLRFQNCKFVFSTLPFSGYLSPSFAYFGHLGECCGIIPIWVAVVKLDTSWQ